MIRNFFLVAKCPLKRELSFTRSQISLQKLQKTIFFLPPPLNDTKMMEDLKNVRYSKDFLILEGQRRYSYEGT